MNEFQCPHCGRQIQASKPQASVSGHAASYRAKRQVLEMAVGQERGGRGGGGGFEMLGDQIVLPLQQWDPTVAGAVGVPALQSLFSGVLVAGGTLAVALGLRVAAPLAWAGAAGFTVTGGVWAWGLWLSHRQVWERWVGKPEPKVEVEDGPGRRDISVTIKDTSGRAMQFLKDWPVDDSRLVYFARKALLPGVALSEGSFVGGGLPFKRPDFNALRDELIARKLAYWRTPGHHKGGWELSRVGRVVMARIVEEAEAGD